MKKFVKRLQSNKKQTSYFIIFVVSIFICIPLFSKYMDISRDDGIQHICRLIENAATLKEGHLFPVINSNLCNGFGYSWNLFYSPFTAYIPLIFKLFTSSFVVALKLFMLATIFLSGITMFQLVYKISKSYKAGIVSAILYMCAPYHLTDLYNRIAVAELASFIFLPMVFNGMYDLFYQKNKMPFGIILGATGLILTHNVIAMYAAIFCLIYLLIHYKVLQEKRTLAKILICILLILLCTSFYWMPLLEHKLMAEYEVFLPDRMYKDNTLTHFKLSLTDLFFTENFNLNFHIGWAIILGMIFTFFYRKKLSKKQKEIFSVFLIFGIASIIMTLKIFPFEHMPSILKMIQFPWRMMEFVSFFFSVIAGFGFAYIMNHHLKREYYVVIFLVVYMCVSLAIAKRNVAIPFKEENYLQAIPVTSSTGRVHAGCASFEYLPKKAFQNRKYMEQRRDEVIVLEGNAIISNMQKENTNLNVIIEQAEENTILELPYIFYLGYSAKIEKEDGTKQNLKIEESDNGFCMIDVSNIEKGTIYVSYAGTIWMKLSYILTLIGVSAIVYIRTKKD